MDEFAESNGYCADRDVYHDMQETPRADWMPPVDIHVSSEAYDIRVELPGVTRNDIDIRYIDGTLSVSGTKHAELRRNHKTRRQRGECVYGSFARCFLLDGVDTPGNIRAHFTNGVLKISVPRKSNGERTYLTIAIE